MKVALPISAVVGAGLILHGVLTYRTIGVFRMSSLAGGLNFIEGKCPSKRNTDPTGSTWLSPIYAQLDMTSAKLWDRPFTDSGYYMRRRPEVHPARSVGAAGVGGERAVPLHRQLPVAGHAVLDPALRAPLRARSSDRGS